MKIIPIDKLPIIIGTVSIKELHVRDVGFEEFIAISAETNSAPGIKNQKQWKQHNLRTRIKAQVSALGEDGKNYSLDSDSITTIPVMYSKSIMDALNQEYTSGELLNDADGISAPLLYRLASPVKIGSTSGEIEVTELEFHAKMFGDIEEVLAETTDPDRALALLRYVARPVVNDVTVLRLPSFAIKQISLGDGMTVSDTILPRFLS